jgi:hypothetical protein
LGGKSLLLKVEKEIINHLLWSAPGASIGTIGKQEEEVGRKGGRSGGESKKRK